MRTLRRLAAETIRGFQRHRVPRLGAAVAFYTVLSIAPLVVVAVGVASMVFARQQVQTDLIDQIRSVVGPAGAKVAHNVFRNAYRAYQPRSGILATIVGVGFLLFGASAVLQALKDAMNTIWEGPPEEQTGFLRPVLIRLVAFVVVLGLGLLLLASLLFATVKANFNQFFAQSIGAPTAVLTVVNGFVSFAFIAVMIALLYRYLPDKWVEWSDAWLGAVAAAVLFEAGKWVLGRYLAHSAVASAYGAAGSFIIVLLWIYWSAQIFFLGAELARSWAKIHGHPDVDLGNGPGGSGPPAREPDAPPRRGRSGRPSAKAGAPAGPGSGPAPPPGTSSSYRSPPRGRTRGPWNR